MSGRPSSRDDLAGAWTALFPLTYCIHVAEEYWGGESFYGWVSRLWQIDFSREEFVALNAAAMIVMISATLAANFTAARWPIAALGCITAFNGALHAVASIVTATYSPGVISGVLIWLPLGGYALWRCWSVLSKLEYFGAIGAGLFAHAVVSALAFNVR
jgi:hypothetical protein